MHRFANSSWKGLICDSLLDSLFSKTDWVNNAFHFVQFFLRHVLLLSCHVLVITVVVLNSRALSLGNATFISGLVFFDGIAIFFSVVSAEMINEISLLIGGTSGLIAYWLLWLTWLSFCLFWGSWLGFLGFSALGFLNCKLLLWSFCWVFFNLIHIKFIYLFKITSKLLIIFKNTKTYFYQN